jgi:hypothetical protein
MAGRLAIFVAAALLAATPAAAGAAPYTIRVQGSADSFGRVLAIGDFKPHRDPLYGSAVSAFGEPDVENSRWGGGGCKVSWHDVGLKVLFANFGGGSACDEELGRSQSARAYGDRWRTTKGLRVGNRLGRLQHLYPAATRHGRSWWLVTAVTHIGETRRYPVLKATLRGGRVNSFVLWIGAAGD